MSEYELQGEWRRLRSLPYSRIQWRGEVIGRDGRPVYLGDGAGSPEESVERWRALLFRCRTDRRWYAARLTIVEPGGD
jgi:hypothetical protein